MKNHLAASSFAAMSVALLFSATASADVLRENVFSVDGVGYGQATCKNSESGPQAVMVQ